MASLAAERAREGSAPLEIEIHRVAFFLEPGYCSMPDDWSETHTQRMVRKFGSRAAARQSGPRLLKRGTRGAAVGGGWSRPRRGVPRGYSEEPGRPRDSSARARRGPGSERRRDGLGPAEAAPRLRHGSSEAASGPASSRPNGADRHGLSRRTDVLMSAQAGGL